MANSPGYSTPDQWQVQTQIQMKANVSVAAGCRDEEETRAAHFEPAEDAGEAVLQALVASGPGASLRLLPPSSIDAVTAFFSIIHVPLDEQQDLLRSIAAWLRPNGLLFATMTARGKETDFDECWLGAPMFWSGHDSDTNKRFVQDAGLDIVSAAETRDSDGHFLWLTARKPGEKTALEDR